MKFIVFFAIKQKQKSKYIYIYIYLTKLTTKRNEKINKITGTTR